MNDFTAYDNDDELGVYKRFVMRILEKINFLYTDQILYMLIKEFYPNVSYKKAVKIVAQMQRDGRLLLSNDGYVMTRSAYRELSDDIFYDKLIKGQTEKVDGSILNLSHLRDNLQTVDCMWIVADMMPASDRFVIGDVPWLVEFFVPAENGHKPRLFQVTKFNKGEELMDGLYLDSLEKYRNPDLQESLRRVIVLDNEDALGVVPHGCGVSLVVVLDNSYERGFRVIDKYDVTQSWNKNAKSNQIY